MKVIFHRENDTPDEPAIEGYYVGPFVSFQDAQSVADSWVGSPQVYQLVEDDIRINAESYLERKLTDDEFAKVLRYFEKADVNWQTAVECACEELE